MGYYVSMHVDLIIPEANKYLALQAINRMYTPELLKKYASGGQKWYSWQNNNSGPFNKLEEAIKAWRYGYKYQPNGDIHIDNFTGEKWGDDELFYQAIAPFVLDHGTIMINGEDGRWSYNFIKGRVTSSEGAMKDFFEGDFNIDDLKQKLNTPNVEALTWSKDPPTKEGVYFCTLGEHWTTVNILKVYEDGTIEEFGTDQTFSLTQNYTNHWWQGPLRFPSIVGLKKLKTIVVEED